MNRFSRALAGSALLALAACGGGGGNEASADNASAVAADNVTLPPDENAAAGAGDTLDNQLNAIDTGNALGNQITENGVANTAASGEGNATVNSKANSATNAQ
jgi:hypothetical protein